MDWAVSLGLAGRGPTLMAVSGAVGDKGQGPGAGQRPSLCLLASNPLGTRLAHSLRGCEKVNLLLWPQLSLS